MENNTVDKPMEAPAAILLVVAAASALLLGSFMVVDFGWGGVRGGEGAHRRAAHAAAPVTNPG